MKKLLPILFFVIFSVGCSMNIRTSKYDNIIDDASKNLDKLTNAKFMDVEEDFGAPHSATYYINADNLRSKDVSNLTLKDLQENIITLASYENPSSKNNFLNVYYENGLVKKAVVGDYKVSKEKLLSNIKLEKYDYKVDFNKGYGIINSDSFNLENTRNKLLNSTIDKFNDYFKVKGANFTATTINNTDKLNFYPLVNQNLDPDKNNNYPNYQSNEDSKLGYVNPINNNISSSNKSNSEDLYLYSDKSVLVYTDKGNTIKNISIADSKLLYNVISKTLGPVRDTSNDK